MKTTIPMTIGIQIGERTQIQDQVIFPISFSVTKTIVNNPQKPIPELLEDDTLDIKPPFELINYGVLSDLRFIEKCLSSNKIILFH